MFDMIRQNGVNSVAVLIRLIEVLTAVASAERNVARLRALQHHADMVRADGERSLSSAGDLADLVRRHAAFTAMRETGRSMPKFDRGPA
jgi:uncharacterized membrane protein